MLSSSPTTTSFATMLSSSPTPSFDFFHSAKGHAPKNNDVPDEKLATKDLLREYKEAMTHGDHGAGLCRGDLIRKIKKEHSQKLGKNEHAAHKKKGGWQQHHESFNSHIPFHFGRHHHNDHESDQPPHESHKVHTFDEYAHEHDDVCIMKKRESSASVMPLDIKSVEKLRVYGMKQEMESFEEELEELEQIERGFTNKVTLRVPEPTKEEPETNIDTAANAADANEEVESDDDGFYVDFKAQRRKFGRLESSDTVGTEYSGNHLICDFGITDEDLKEKE